MHSWITAHIHAFSFFGGIPLILRPDNTKTAVIKPDRYEPDLQDAYRELADHYQTVIIPARVRKPKDKPTAEGSVGFITRRIIADLQNQQFFSLDELNTAIWERMDALNAGPFTKKPGSRLELFTAAEQEALLPLPKLPFVLYKRKSATVAPDFHIQFDKSFYSVPYKYIRCNVLVKASAHEVIIEHPKKGIIASHKRANQAGSRITNPEHVPERARVYSSWNSDTFLTAASRIGENTGKMITMVLASREYEVQTYRTCVGVLNLGKKFGDTLLEQACGQALEMNIRSYKGIKSLLTALQEEQQDTHMTAVSEEIVGDDDNLDEYYCCHTSSSLKEDA